MNLTDLIKFVGPSESSRANNRRPEDGSRFLSTLLKRIIQIDRIAAHAGLVIVVEENKAMKQQIADQYNVPVDRVGIKNGVVTLAIDAYGRPEYTIIGEIKAGQFVALLSPEEI